MKKTGLLLFVWLGFPWLCFGQILPFKPHWLSAQLPSTECYGVYQDKRGYLWVRTDAGICRSNGRNMKWIEPSTGSDSLVCYALAEYSSGKIWISTSDGRLGYVKGDSVQFLDKELFTNLISNSEHPCFYQLNIAKSGVLYGTTSNGIFKVTKKEGSDKIETDFLSFASHEKNSLGLFETGDIAIPANSSQKNIPTQKSRVFTYISQKNYTQIEIQLAYDNNPKYWRNLA